MMLLVRQLAAQWYWDEKHFRSLTICGRRIIFLWAGLNFPPRQSICWSANPTLSLQLLFFWHECAVFQRSAFGRSTAGNDIVATILICLFRFLHCYLFSQKECSDPKTYLPKVGRSVQKPRGTPLSRPRRPLTRGWSPTKDGHPPEGRKSTRIKKLT